MSGGRPTTYRKEFVELAHNYGLLGATDEEMAGFFGVTRKTFREWMTRHKEFRDTIKSAKYSPDSKVAASLYKRATGYTYSEKKTVTKHIKVGSDEQDAELVETTITEKHIVPETVACIYWLKNRQRAKWKDKWPDAPTGDAAKPGVILVPAISAKEWGGQAAKQQADLKKEARS